MLSHFDNLVIGSFMAYLDHSLIKNAQAYINHSGYFYPSNTIYNGKYTYASPFSQFIADTSLSGPVIMSGIWLSGTFTTTGTNGFYGIDYQQGRTYFSTQVVGNTAVSGQYAIKDFNICLTSDSDEQILFENKVNLRPKLSIAPTGLLNNEITYPVIFLKKESSEDKPFAFGGTKESHLTIKAIVMADSQFKIDAIEGFCRDLTHTHVPILNREEMPYNNFGGLKSGSYHYDNLVNGKILAGSGAFIKNVYCNKLNRSIENINDDAYLALIYFELSAIKGYST
jgi:hypothetical protein